VYSVNCEKQVKYEVMKISIVEGEERNCYNKEISSIRGHYNAQSKKASVK
jgi:hypothetical protein